MVFAGFNWFLIIVSVVSTCQHWAHMAVQVLLYVASEAHVWSTLLLHHASTPRKLHLVPVLAASRARPDFVFLSS